MVTRFRFRAVFMVLMGAVLALAFACGGDDESDAEPTPDIAALVRDSVSSAVAAAPQGASADEIQKMVQDAVAASAGEGVSAEDLAAAVQQASQGQLTAAQVQAIVEQSLMEAEAGAVPTPDIAALVRDSVSSAVAAQPQGVSAAEIQRMVQNAVAASAGASVSAEDLEAALQQASQGQLTAEQVQAIVADSLKETEAAIARAADAAEAAQMTAQSALEVQDTSADIQAAVEAALAASVATEGEEKVLRVRMSSMPAQFAPHTQGSGAMAQVMGWIFSRVAQANPSTGQWAPDLVSRWELSDDFTSMTLHLRSDATWHDGTPVTAADFDYTVRSFLGPEMSSWMLGTMTSIKGAQAFMDAGGDGNSVPGVVTLDDNTVRVDFEMPSINFLDDLNNLCGLAPIPILPAHLLDAIPVGQLYEHDFWSNGLVGSGPWRFVQWVPDQFLEMVANDDFYFGRPQIDRIIMAIIPSNDATQIALQRGEVDTNVRGGISEDAQRALLLDPRFDVWATANTVSGGFSFNMRVPVINDPRLHQAWLHALDREKLLQTFSGGLGNIVNTPLTHGWYQKPEWQDMYKYNPDTARELLAEMGWDSNRAIPINIGPIRNEQQAAQYAAEQQYLAEVGIKVDFKVLESAASFDAFYVDHSYEVTHGGGGGIQGGPAQYLLGRWVTCDAPSCDPWGYSEYSGWDDLIYAGAAITDRAEAAAHWQMINEEYMMKDLPVAGLWIAAGVKVKNKRFVMPIYGEIPKPSQLNQIRIYPVHIGRDDNWQFHPEQWFIE